MSDETKLFARIVEMGGEHRMRRGSRKGLLFNAIIANGAHRIAKSSAEAFRTANSESGIRDQKRRKPQSGSAKPPKH